MTVTVDEYVAELAAGMTDDQLDSLAKGPQPCACRGAPEELEYLYDVNPPPPCYCMLNSMAYNLRRGSK